MLEDIIYEYYESVDSTNDRVKERAHQGQCQGLVISAGNQTAGKGRIGRKWQSPSGDTISTSILLRPEEIAVENISTITIIAAMAVRSALEDTCGLCGLIKWPNDIVLDGKKVCGILTEMEMRMGRVWYVVCGVGVNIHNRNFPDDIAYKATSVDLELEKLRDSGAESRDILRGSRSQITHAIWESFREYYNIFIKTQDMTGLRDEYEKYLANKGKTVRIEDPAGQYLAKAVGIDNSGRLVIDVDGQTKYISTGEVSVRGIYGYVDN